MNEIEEETEYGFTTCHPSNLVNVELDQYFAEREISRSNFSAYIDLKKEIVKQNCRSTPESFLSFDFNELLGYTIKEKYESFIFEVIKETRRIGIDDCNDCNDAYWILAPVEISCLFEVTETFDPTGSEYATDGLYCGSLKILSDYWHVLKTSTLKSNEFIAGCGNHCFKGIFTNFIL